MERERQQNDSTLANGYADRPDPGTQPAVPGVRVIRPLLRTHSCFFSTRQARGKTNAVVAHSRPCRACGASRCRESRPGAREPTTEGAHTEVIRAI